jgi:predicted AAA+ superfamily ATPase
MAVWWIDRKIGHVLESHRKIFPVVLVTGPRQSGKTSLLRHAFPSMRYVSLDDPMEANRAMFSPDEFLSQHASPVIIDEIQYAPRFLRHIKIAADASAKKGRFFLLDLRASHLCRAFPRALPAGWASST